MAYGKGSDLKPILIVEDSPLFGSLVCKMIRQQLSHPLIWVQTFAEAKEQIEKYEADFCVALLDLNLPDAEMGDVVDYAVSRHIPSIVFTSRFSPELSDQIWAKGVIDYVLKEGPDSLHHIVKQIRRQQRNHLVKILVADDSEMIRRQLMSLLRIQGFEVVGAADGEQALAILTRDRDIRLLLTDYHMPGLDGFQLIRKVRRIFSQNELAIIGLSAQDDTTLSAKFLKYGANDYIVRPFLRDEFYCRVHQNIDLLEKIGQIKETAERDYLTGLYNSRYFFAHWERTVKGHDDVALAMLDIDYFKQVNDRYGHDAGDLVLKQVASLINDHAGAETLVARFGGEEFCLLLPADQDTAVTRMNDLCRSLRERTILLADGTSLNVTISIGLYCGKKQAAKIMIKLADDNLYRAKSCGRDRVLA